MTQIQPVFGENDARSARKTSVAVRPVADELRTAGPTVELPLANRALGISRAHGYALARRGEYPVRLLKLGSSYRVITAELLALLGIGEAS